VYAHRLGQSFVVGQDHAWFVTCGGSNAGQL
jgi:hypothetical protein